MSGAGHSNEAPKESGVCLEMGPTPCFWTSDVVLSSPAPSALEPQSGSVTSSCPWYSAGPGKGDRLRSVCLSHVTSRGHRPRIIRFYTPVTPTMSGRSRSHKRWWNRWKQIYSLAFEVVHSVCCWGSLQIFPALLPAAPFPPSDE